jgi:preprotein translocase subunit SecF
MRAISGAIVALAGAVIFAAGVMSVGGNEFAMIVGGLLTLVGFSAWIAGLKTGD